VPKSWGKAHDSVTAILRVVARVNPERPSHCEDVLPGPMKCFPREKEYKILIQERVK
jgi:hypothetical protein